MEPTTNGAAPAKTPQKKQKESWGKTLLRIVISVLVIAFGILALLYVIRVAAHYDSIGSMLRHMWGELTYMWNDRLRS